MPDIIELLFKAKDLRASDVFIITGARVSAKYGSEITAISDEVLSTAHTEAYISRIYEMSGRDRGKLEKTGDDDFSFSVPAMGRFRCNVYRQRGSLSAVLRFVAFELTDYRELGIPKAIIDLYTLKKGLVLITGSAGSGKSTTLSCIVDMINKNLSSHIITIEDPIEFLHRHGKSIISQREVMQDTESYVSALRAALRQAPDVILLGEMRDYETITTAMTAAETGQLVLSTLHTVGAANTIDRIVDVFEPGQQRQIRTQLSMVLQAVVSQKLIPGLDGGLVPAFEIMIANNAIRNLIRESKIHQIDNVIYSGGSEGMVAMDADIFRLWREKRISAENAVLYSNDAELMQKKIASGGG